MIQSTDHVGVLVGHDTDPDLADHGAEMVAAGAAHGERADDHQLVQVLGIRELGNRRLGHVAALEHLIEVHLGHAARGVLGVVVVLGVDDQAVKHALHLDLDLVQQGLQFFRLDELGNVVVGIETLARCDEPLTDLDGNRNPFIPGIGRHVGCSWSGHDRIVPAIQRHRFSGFLGLWRLSIKRKQLSIK
jgi:hypothetical protein